MDLVLSRNESVKTKLGQCLVHGTTLLTSPEGVSGEAIKVVWLHVHPGDDVSSRLGAVTQRFTAARVVVLSNIPSDAEGMQAIIAGASGYMNALARTDVYEQVRQTVVSGHVWLGQSLLLEMVRQMGRTLVPKADTEIRLSEREQLLVRHLGKGLSNQAIAEAIGLSEQTIKNQLSALYRKYNVKDRLSLIMALGNLQARDFGAQAARGGE
ncbi:response regulator transcription factor [Pokkaliibacter sp. CJK22405]|uniref:helix-turn-helix transcriptional regulator n=1 Tax=Pokkaliibacter sp. CJK22405 TaxID=3384615 RepID=UPI003984CAEB